MSPDQSLNPWVSKRPSCKTQTGGDWYNIMLTASLKGKTLHGCNSAPTCEVLCKSPSFENSDRTVGHIRWDPHVMTRPHIGSDLSDQFYTHHSFKGTVTSSGNVLAYESGLWEPSLRARAKSTSLLAAGIHAHGCSIQDAISSVSLIASDEIDEEAVACAILPASHLKREMTIVSKSTHRVFTRGTLQAGIEWDDSDLSISSRYPSVAFDWGRVTAIARYIAEANIQACPTFRQIASSLGVPYFVVRDAWAYVTPSDYHLLPGKFAKAPRLHLGEFRIPSLKGAFLNHEEDIIIALTRSLDHRSFVPDSDTLSAYADIYRAAKYRLAKRKRDDVVLVSDYLDAPVIEAHMSQESVHMHLENAQVPRRALIQAIATRRANDPLVRDSVAVYQNMDPLVDRDAYYVQLDEATKMALGSGTWTMAKAIGEEEIRGKLGGEDLTGCLAQFSYMLAQLKRDMFGIPTHISARTVFTNDLLIRLRPHTKSLLADLEDTPAIVSMTQSRLVGYEMQEIAGILADLAEKASGLLPTLTTTVAQTFQAWADGFSGGTSSAHRQVEANLAFTAYALRNLSVSDCKNQTTGFIDGAAPERTYIRCAIREMAMDRGWEVHKLKRYYYSNAHQLASECDSVGSYPFSVVEVVKFVTGVLGDVVSDLLVGRVYEPDEGILRGLCGRLPIPDSPPYDTSMVDEEEELALLAARHEGIEGRRRKQAEDHYVEALNSYPNAQMAEAYAQVSGYDSFRDAFLALGVEAFYFENSKYIAEAASFMELRRPAKMDNGKKKKYGSLI